MGNKTPLCPMLMQGMFSNSDNEAAWAADACACIGSRCAWWASPIIQHASRIRGVSTKQVRSASVGHCARNPDTDPFFDPATTEET